MEGRGAYSACRTKRLDEWIIIKAICDWGENKENPNKEADQITAAKSVVSLLKHVFSIPSAFDRLPQRTPAATEGSVETKDLPASKPLGYFISIGITSCRLFEVRNNQVLHEITVSSYEISDPLEDGYLAGIISHVKHKLLPIIQEKPSRLFPKVFVDYNFSKVFEAYNDYTIQKDFIREFYIETNLYFNILSKSQAVENLKRLFGDIKEHSAIISINTCSIDLLIYSGKEYSITSLTITLEDIENFTIQNKISEIWDDNSIRLIKSFISKKIGSALDDMKIESAIIIKDELTFMLDLGYPLKHSDGQLGLSQHEYKESNRKLLFQIDYRSKLTQTCTDDATIRRLYGFKYGHILIETILELLHNQRVIPKNDHSVYGSSKDAYGAYIFNVVVSGSTHDGRGTYILEARSRLEKMGANVLSPRIKSDGSFHEITSDSEYEHLKAIDESDMLFVCNNGDDRYIGESTRCEIYYAYALRKTIAFWQDPPEEKQLSFIPRESWSTIMSLEVPRKS